MRVIRFVHCVGAAVVLLAALWTAGVTGALASVSASASARCSTVKVNPGKRYGGKQTLRVATVGRVPCGKARHLTRAYFRKMGAGKCGHLNNFCDLRLAGGWSCSLFSAIETQETGGAIAGCARRAERVRMYPVGKRTA